MDTHVYPYQQLHEGGFAMDADLITADDFNEFFLSVDGAADSVNTSIVTIGTCAKKVGDHKQTTQTRIRIIL